MQRGASLTTSEHIDPASPPAQLAEMNDPDSADIPEGAVRFNITAEDIAAALAEDSIEVLFPGSLDSVLVTMLPSNASSCWAWQWCLRPLLLCLI